MDIQTILQTNGPFAAIAIWLIIRQNRRFDDLESWVRKEVTCVIRANTSVLTQVKEKLDAD